MNYKIFIINLERSKERKEKIRKQLVKYKITNYEFFNAIDGDTIIDASVQIHETRSEKDVKNPFYINHFSPKELGCLRSHIQVLECAQTLNLDYVIVLEDDIILCEDWNNRLVKFFKLVPKNWNHIFLSCLPDENIEKFHPLNFAPFLHVEKSISSQGAFSYIVKNEVFEKIKQEFLKFEYPSDTVINNMNLRGELNSYTVYPFMTYHDNNIISDIWEREYEHNHNSIRYFKQRM